MTDNESDVARLFDELTPSYDQSGVEFFGPIAERLVQLLEPEPGEHAVDLGCGRGAATTRLARAVGPKGQVTALDVSSRMVAATKDESARQGLSWVRARTGDASTPDVPAGSASIVAASLVLFFLPDPTAAFGRWLDLLSPGGRIGITTFGPQDAVWRAVDELFDPYLPAGMLDARTTGRRGPFSSAAALATMIETAGGEVVSLIEEPLSVRFADAGEWERFSMGTGQRRMWGLVPDRDRASVLAAAGALLETARPEAGAPIQLSQVVRYTCARVARGDGSAGTGHR